jgi:hypothetical protein
MPDPTKILATIRRAAELTRNAPGRTGSIIDLDDDAEDVLVVGDLHGHIHTFARALKLAALDRQPRRHVVFQELVHDPRIDPDSGIDQSHRLVDLVCALRCQYPGRVHLILGNHELSELTGRSIGKSGVQLNELFRAGVARSYGETAKAILDAYKELFAALPLAVRTANRVLVCHTLPNGTDLDRLDLDLVRTGAWTPESLHRGGTIYALTWGRDTSPETADRFAAMIDADLFVCGHQPCEAGFLQANHRQLILDGTDPYPTGCLFPARGSIDMATLVAGVRMIAADPRQSQGD